MEVLLPTAISMNSPLSDVRLNVSLDNNFNIINDFDIEESVNLYNVYLNERNRCTLYRLIATIDGFSSNVLFNPISIILNNNGVRVFDSAYTCLNTCSNYVTSYIYSPSLYNNYTCLCGYNVFDNYLFRSFLFKKSAKLDDTIPSSPTNNNFVYVYLMDDIMSFPSSISNSLIEYNGWVGFKNPSQLTLFTDNGGTPVINSFSFLKNKKNCDFIDMFPNREMFSFKPIVNYENSEFSMEYNWNYYLSYPYKSDYSHFLVQDTTNNINGVPILYVTFLSTNDSNNIFSVPVIEVQTAYKNNLSSGDKIQIESISGFLNEYVVLRVVDDTTFYVKNDNSNVTSTIRFNKSRLRKIINGIKSEYYIRKFRKLPNWKFENEEITENNIKEKLEINNTPFTNSLSGLPFSKTIYDDDINQIIFTDSLDIKYLRDNMNRPLTELYLTIIKNNDVNTIYQQYWGNLSSGFELNNINDNNLWFSGNVNDMNSFINDYPSIFYLHNLQNNDDGTNLVMPTGNSIALPYTFHIKNIGEDNSGNNTLEPINQQPDLWFPVSPNSLDNNIGDVEVNGDIVEFNAITMDEVVLCPVMYRFNTKMRESFNESDRIIKFHEIYQDDEDKGLTSLGYTQLLPQYNAFTAPSNSFSTTTIRQCDNDNPVQNTSSNYIYRGQLNVGPRPEGYYYKAHNKIQLKNWSNVLNQRSFAEIYLSSFGTEDYNGITQLYFITQTPHRLINEDLVRIEIENTTYDEIFNVRINMRDSNKFLILFDTQLSVVDITKIHVRYFSKDVPQWSKHIGSGRYVWKNPLNEGEREDINEEALEHVFTNGHLYLDEKIKFYLRRQSNGNTNLLYKEFPNDLFPENIDISNYIYNDPNLDC